MPKVWCLAYSLFIVILIIKMQFYIYAKLPIENMEKELSIAC